MIFNSLVFVVFAAVFFCGWPLLRRNKNARWIYLTVSAFVFYGWWDWRFLFLLAATGLVDFWGSLAMERWPRYRKLCLVVSMTANIGALATFKYLDFTIRNCNWLLGALGVSAQIPLANLVLPVGISFYTFQSMSYTIDVYRRHLSPTHNVFHFFAFVSVFPHLVAGPINRAVDLLPQLEKCSPTTERGRWEGTQLIGYGFFKKMVVADTLAQYVNSAFAAASPLESCAYWWCIMTMFAFQIYCDFSGYTDIARGLAKWMGYEFPINFSHPYIATSFRDFWTRWHVSLSSWFRDYLYLPLGGSRKGVLRSHVNMWITMLVSGLWHGAAWTFIAWAALHAFHLSLERVTQWPKRLAALPLGRHLCVIAVFVLGLVTWVFFRAQSFEQAWAILGRMFDVRHFDYQAIPAKLHLKAMFVLLLAMLRQAYVHLGLGDMRWVHSRWASAVLRPAAVAALMVACVYYRGPGAAFIYFQF